jgi:hypothetical protein
MKAGLNGRGMALVCWFVMAVTGLMGQGRFDPVVVNPVAGEALVGVTERLSFWSGLVNPGLRIKIGFGTDESGGPGVFSDSFSVTLETDDRSVTLLLMTFDPRGVVWAPPTPGTTPLSEEAIQRSAIEYPSLTPVLGNLQAYQVEVALPREVLGQGFTMYFDLFSNDNGIASQGWYADLQLIPEPGVMWLGMVGLALCLFRWRRV